MAAAQDVFEEHLGVIAALKDNYTRQDDAASVASINGMREELAQLCVGREEDVKAAIRELTRRVAQAEADAAYPNPEGAHAQRVADLEGAAAEAREGVAQLSGELQALEEARQALKQRFAELHARGEQIERMVAETEPHTRHNLSLYAHVSKITWKFDDPARSSGDVSIPATGDIRNFDFDAAAAAEFEAVNRLWDMMDGK